MTPLTEPNFSPDHSLTPTQHHVLNLLADGGTISAAAASAGIHRNTIRNWRRSIPEFARELEAATREQSLYWHEQVVALAPKAIETLCTILHNEAATTSQKLRAATIILKMSIEPATPQPKQARPHPPELSEEVLAMDQEIAQAAQRAQSDAQHAQPTTIRLPPGPARNTLCPCNSGLKYKRCCAAHPQAA